MGEIERLLIVSLLLVEIGERGSEFWILGRRSQETFVQRHGFVDTLLICVEPGKIFNRRGRLGVELRGLYEQVFRIFVFALPFADGSQLCERLYVIGILRQGGAQVLFRLLQFALPN